MRTRRLTAAAAGVLLAAGLAAPAVANADGDEEEFTPRSAVDYVTGVGGEAGVFDDIAWDFDILTNAVVTADLVDALSVTEGDLTLFAPKDRAFIRLANDLGYEGHDEEEVWNFLVETLTELGDGDPIPLLTTILTAHVAPAQLNVIDVAMADSVATLQGLELDVMLTEDNEVVLGDADPDIQDPTVELNRSSQRIATGSVHVIKRVIIPADL